MTAQEVALILKEIIPIVLALIAIFGSTGFWTWLSNRRKTSKTKDALDTMSAVMDTQQKTVTFLRERLDEMDKIHIAEDARHARELKELEDSHKHLVDELTRQLNVIKTQFSDCRKLLHEKTALVDQLHAQMDGLARELEDIKSRIPTRPLRPPPAAAGAG